MHIKEVLQDIVRHMPIDNIPKAFVSMVKIKDRDGNRSVIRGQDLTDFFIHPQDYGSVETKFVVDTDAIFRSIQHEVDFVFEEVERMQQARF